MMATTSFILAFPMALIWPTIQSGLNAFSTGLLDRYETLTSEET
jgi:phosphotransferase system  glucose/maltose/N-acetylglucosamine-specific IIC component